MAELHMLLLSATSNCSWNLARKKVKVTDSSIRLFTVYQCRTAVLEKRVNMDRREGKCGGVRAEQTNARARRPANPVYWSLKLGAVVQGCSMWPETQLYQLTAVVQFPVDRTLKSRGQKATSSMNCLVVDFLKSEDYLKNTQTFSFSSHCVNITSTSAVAVLCT
jgi:hypothetical protein